MKIKQVNEVASTKWLCLKEAIYLDKKGKEQKWQYCERTKAQQVVSVVGRDKRHNKLLFISQPRVPLNKIVISFPGGLIDDGESPEEAALRELKEETGYEGEIFSVSPTISKSAGMTSETSTLVECWIDSKAVGKSNLEVTEEIQTFWLTPLQFLKMVESLDPEKYMVSSEAWHYVSGYINSRKKPLKKK